MTDIFPVVPKPLLETVCHLGYVRKTAMYETLPNAPTLFVVGFALKEERRYGFTAVALKSARREGDSRKPGIFSGCRGVIDQGIQLLRRLSGL